MTTYTPLPPKKLMTLKRVTLESVWRQSPGKEVSCVRVIHMTWGPWVFNNISPTADQQASEVSILCQDLFFRWSSFWSWCAYSISWWSPMSWHSQDSCLMETETKSDDCATWERKVQPDNCCNFNEDHSVAGIRIKSWRGEPHDDDHHRDRDSKWWSPWKWL